MDTTSETLWTQNFYQIPEIIEIELFKKLLQKLWRRGERKYLICVKFQKKSLRVKMSLKKSNNRKSALSLISASKGIKLFKSV